MNVSKMLQKYFNTAKVCYQYKVVQGMAIVDAIAVKLMKIVKCEAAFGY